MCIIKPMLKISPEKIREAAWELWSDEVDGVLKEHAPIEWFDESVKRVIKEALGNKFDLK